MRKIFNTLYSIALLGLMTFVYGWIQFVIIVIAAYSIPTNFQIFAENDLLNLALIIILFISPLFIISVLMDKKFGDPNSKYHPIVGFGKLVAWGEKRFNQGNGSQTYLRGSAYNSLLSLFAFLLPAPVLWIIMMIPIGLERFSLFLFPLDIFEELSNLLCVVLYILTVFFMLSGKTLRDEVEAVFGALEESLKAGRKQVARIVGRDTQSLSRHEVQTAALETLSENLSDGVVAPMFCWAVLGLPGMLMYKMANTQDSMIGYKNDRYGDYGYFSAKFDDLLNYIPARLTAFLMILSVGKLRLFGFIRKYGPQHASPNAGYPEAALAGILNCRFGGPHDYFGQVFDKPYIGENERPFTYADVEVALKINRRVEWLMTGLAIILRFALLFLFFSFFR